jgi:hypothetical protein
MVDCSKCQHNLQPDYFIIQKKYEKIRPPKKIDKYEKYEKILSSLINTELFCMPCCITHTYNICDTSNILKNNYSFGYTHKIEK